MGRSKDLTLVSRDRQIVEMAAQGYTYQVIADTVGGITRQRVAQIVQEYRETINDDATREQLAMQMDGAIDILWGILRGPGKLAITPGGSIVYQKDENGKIDFSQPVYDPYAKTDVINTLIKALERQSRFRGIDRAKQKSLDQSQEMGEILAEVERIYSENAELRRKIEQMNYGVIEAEVVEEEDTPPNPLGIPSNPFISNPPPMRSHPLPSSPLPSKPALLIRIGLHWHSVLTHPDPVDLHDRAVEMRIFKVLLHRGHVVLIEERSLWFHDLPLQDVLLFLFVHPPGIDRITFPDQPLTVDVLEHETYNQAEKDSAQRGEEPVDHCYSLISSRVPMLTPRSSSSCMVRTIPRRNPPGLLTTYH